MAAFDFLTMEDPYQEKSPRKYAVQDINEMSSVSILIQQAILSFVGNERYDQVQIIEFVIAEIGVDRPTAIKGLSWLVDSKRLVTSHGPQGSILYQKPTEEQFGNSIVDDLIFRNVPCVLLYKDGILDIIPVADYVVSERKELQNNSSYKTERVPIGYGSYGEMLKCKEKIGRDGLGTIGTLLLDRI
jgi:hypothetical protein